MRTYRVYFVVILFLFQVALCQSIAWATDDDLKLGDRVPDKTEAAVVKEATAPIKRGSPEFDALTVNANADVGFDSDDAHRMTAKVSDKVNALASLVKVEWTGYKLHVNAAWSDDPVHKPKSTHLEGRAVDIVVEDSTGKKDKTKLGRLGRLAVKAGFEWVWFEDANHVHASMSK